MLASLLASLGATGAAIAQTPASVQGTVTDSANARPIPGVQVVIVGSTRGAMTDEAGRYVIRGVPAGSATLRAQRIGFAPRTQAVTVPASGTVTQNFTLSATAAVLSEVVTIGYGTRSRAEVSSAVAQVSGEQVANVAVAGVDAALQGKAPGVQVVQNAGNPGNGITIRVRGSSSISAENQPLYVVDGVPMIRENMSQIAFGGQDVTAVTGLSPNEIESIDVLKDAAAAAIYGSRASNGVIMITTKRGRPGRTRWSFNSYYGSQNALRTIDLLSGPEFVAFMQEAFLNDGYTEADAADWGFQPGVDDQYNTDWQAAMLRTAPVADMTLTAQGGGDRFQYMLSGSNFLQDGIILGSAYRRQNGRLNLDVTATEKLSFRSSLGLSREHFDRIENDNSIEGAGANALALPSNLPIYRPGTENSGARVFSGVDEGLPYVNPVALATFNEAPATALRFLGNIEATYEFAPTLRLNARVGGDIYNLHERRWDSPRVEGSGGQSADGIGTQTSNQVTKYIAELYGNWDAIQSASQRASITVGTSAEYNRFELMYLEGQGFASDAFRWPASASKITFYDGRPSQNNLMSVFSRLNYSLNDRYLATLSFRGDGSSRFGEKSRWGFFPAASLGWVVSEEPALGALRNVASLKLRASYGETGNQAIPTNVGFMNTYSRANYAGAPGIGPNSLGNPNLRWETTREFDIGADLGLLDGRVSIIADYYHKKTDDLLVSRPVSGTSGFTSVYDNVGAIENKGVEFQLSTVNFQPADESGFRWTTDFNIASNRNKVLKLYNGEPFIATSIGGVSRVEEGHPLGAFYTLEFLGVDPETGDATFTDVNGDGRYTAADHKIVGNPHPDYFGGLRNQLSWKGFDLNTFLQYSIGNDVFNLFRAYSEDGGCSIWDNKMTHVLKRWQQPGDQTDVPRASVDCTSGAWQESSRWVEDGSYLRLQEVTLGFRLPNAALSRLGMENARLYVSGQNLHLWTKYLGYDPDVNSMGSDSNASFGIDFYAYPRARTITFGLSGSW